MAQTLRHAMRRLVGAPVFAVAAVLTLALGIGAATAVFSLVNGVLLRPLPYMRSDRLVDLSHTLAVSGVMRVDQSDATYLYYRRANRVFSDLGVYRATAVNVAAVGGSAGRGSQPERVVAARISAGTFGALRVTPLRGRIFSDLEDHPGAPPVVLLGQRLWERKYGADPEVLGRRIDVDGVAREVVGIMPASVRFPASQTELWVPIGIDPANTKSAAFDYRGVARLREGVSLQRAAADLQRLLPRVPEAFPGRLTSAAIEQTQMRAIVHPLRDVVVGNVGRVLWVVLAAASFLLLVACANVANLFLVRGEGRQQEIAVRRALGAGRRALAAEFLSEGVILGVVGGALGLVVALAGVGILRSLEAGVDIPRLHEASLDAAVLAVAVGVTLLTVLLVSGLPVLTATTQDLSSALSGTNRSATAGRGRSRARQTLVIAQVALALVLLVGAGLMARSFAQLRAVQPGFDVTASFAFRVTLPEARYPTSADATGLIVRVVDGLAAIPGVQAAGVVTKLPLDDEARRDTALFVEDRPLSPGTIPNIHQVAYASPGYFRALGIPVVAGVTFDRVDPARARREVVLTRALVARYWSDGRAVGKRVRMNPGGAWYTVVGVVGDVRGTALEQPPDEMIYLPLVTTPRDAEGDTIPRMRWTPREVAFVVRGAGNPALLSANADGVMRALDPTIPVYRARAMRDVVADASARTTFTMLLLGVASAAALALGAVGIYGVISYAVSMRTREIAVRIALGARPTDVGRMVSRQAVVLATLGIVIGVGGALAMTRVLSALLFGVSPTDPLTIASAAALLLGVAMVASWVPARRAAAVDPARALRAE